MPSAAREERGAARAPSSLLPFRRPWQPWLVLAVVAAGLYVNTLRHGFALDDGIVINRNRHVLQGLRGLPGIFTSDSYQSYYEQMGGASRLRGGRYRPLSLATFALEQQIVGTWPGGVLPPRCWDRNGNGRDDADEDVNGDGTWNDADCYVRGYRLRHLGNVALYVVSVLLIYALLARHPLREQPDAAFVAALLFAVHPVHTEVVANVKSRDEILSLLFIVLALIAACRHLETGRARHLAGVAAATLLAAFSKEYAFALLALVPATVWLLGKERPLRRHLGLALAVAVPLAVFAAARLAVLPPGGPPPPPDVLSDPYLLATPSQAAGTKAVVWSKYLGLLFFPAVLVSDYGYRSIPYRELAGGQALASLALFAALALLAVWLARRRHAAGWGLVFFFATFLPVANVLFDVGTTMAERLIYHASLGWAVAAGWACVAVVQRPRLSAPGGRAALLAGLAAVVVLAGVRTVARNRDWRNDTALFTHDVTVAPDSVLCLTNAGGRWIDLAELPAWRGREAQCLRTAIGYLQRALALYPDYLTAHLSLGLAHFKLREYDEAERSWNAAARIHPGSPYLARYFRVLADAWSRQGMAALFAGDCAKARAAFERCLRLDPGNGPARRGLERCR
ncbi:MAG TPA: tetratricopeptide repeat protein [bacterium]